MNWHAYSIKGPGAQTDWSEGQADALRGWTDALNVSNGTETGVIGHGEGAGTYLGAGDTRRDANTTDGIGSQSDMSIGCGDVPSIKTNANKPADAGEIIRIP